MLYFLLSTLVLTLYIDVVLSLSISLSSLGKLYLKTLNLSNACQIEFVECVRLSIFSQLSIIHYVGLCVFSLPISFVMIDGIYILCHIVIIKSEVWTITLCLGLGHETMVCAVCLSLFLFIIQTKNGSTKNTVTCIAKYVKGKRLHTTKDIWQALCIFNAIKWLCIIKITM